MQLGEMYHRIVKELASAGISEAKTEAGIILREYAGADRNTILSHPETALSFEAYNNIEQCIKRRLVREPLQYILGQWDFMGLSFSVKPGVLIPRPDTEILVEAALKEIHDGMKILDLCTGSGCILISLLHYSNDTEGVGVDISPQALELASKNSKLLLEEEKRPKIIYSDLYSSVNEVYDVIVSNPPYIDSEVIDTLEDEVKKYEPILALDGGEDGLDLVRRIIDGAGEHLIPGGVLLLEIGYDQGERVTDLMKAAGFINIECIKDYAGLDRVVKGNKSIL